MIWTTWRQHRAEAAVGTFILVALAAALVSVGNIARDRASALGHLPACTDVQANCLSAAERLHRDFHSIPPFTAALVALPLLAGMFWAAPLVSREYDAGTHRLAWTQSVSPLRWITTKIALTFGTVGAASVVVGLLTTWALDPLVKAFSGRYNSTWYDIQGAVPVACMLFALAVGVAASALIRRTIPAMAVTLVVYAAARIPIHWIRAHFAPTTTHTFVVPAGQLLQNPGGEPQDFAATPSPSDWLQGTTLTDSSGHPIVTNNGNFGVLQHFCPSLRPDSAGNIHVDSACQSILQTASIHEKITYQPASHFWLIQTVESAIFVGLAALLVTLAIYAVTHRRPT